MKPNFEAQTDLNVDQVLNCLQGKTTSHYPYCLLLNELGVLCYHNQDPDKKGEEYLVQCLDDHRLDVNAIAFCCLAWLPEAKEKYSAIMAEFKNKPENVESLDFIAANVPAEQED